MLKYVENITYTILTIIAIFVLYSWQNHQPEIEVQFSKPGLDNAPADRGKVSNEIKIGEFFQAMKNYTPAQSSTNWPQFRGINSDNISTDKVSLANQWPTMGPKVLWRKAVGEGHSGTVIYNGEVFLLDYLEDEEADALRCFNLRDGSEKWRRWYKVPVKRNHGKSRTVPAVNEKYVVTIGPKCHVMCVERKTGKLIWTKDLLNDYAGKLPQWYTGQCPLIDGENVILAPAGEKCLVMAVDLETGKTVWEVPNKLGLEMSHASVIPMTIHGQLQYVYTALGGTVGISSDGKLQWSTTDWRPSVLAPSPVYLGDNRIYLTAGYGAGATTLKIVKTDNQFRVEKEANFTPKQGLALEQQSAILWRNQLFGICPKDSGANRQQLAVVDPKDISKFTALSGRDQRFGLGPFIVADEKIYVLSDNGTLSMYSFVSGKLNRLATHKILNGHDAWAPIAIADGLMVLRDSKEMICIDLR